MIGTKYLQQRRKGPTSASQTLGVVDSFTTVIHVERRPYAEFFCEPLQLF